MDSSIKPIFNNGVITTPERDEFEKNSNGVGCVFFKYFKKHATKTMQIDGFTDEKDTYASVLQRIIRVALKMLEWGIKPDDTISLCSLNHINACVPYFAALFIGCKTVCFDQSMNVVEAELLLQQVDPKIMFVELDAIGFVESILADSRKCIQVICFGESLKYDNFFDLLVPHPEENNFEPVEVDETKTAFIFFSSGSTGMPKAIYLSHRAYLEQIATSGNLNEPYDRLVDFSSFYWSTTIHCWGFLIIKGFCKILIGNIDDMNLVWKAFEKHQPTFLLMTPFFIRTLIQSKPENANVDYVKTIFIIGSLITDCEIIQIREKCPKSKVVRVYGVSEAGLVLVPQTKTKKDIELFMKKMESIGSVLNAISYKVVDENSEEVLGPHQNGELRIKTKGLFSGYYNTCTTEFLDDDGWYKTGDVVYYDEDYYFYYVERLKHMIKFQSCHVSSRMIENVLMLREDVSNVCVIGIPHHLDEEHPMAIVELKKPCVTKENLEQEMLDYVQEKLGDKFLLRKGIKFIDKIPVTPTGKYNVRKLKSMFVKTSN